MIAFSPLLQQPLTQVAVWTLGEFGDLLITGQTEDEEPLDVSVECITSLLPSHSCGDIKGLHHRDHMITEVLCYEDHMITGLLLL